MKHFLLAFSVLTVCVQCYAQSWRTDFDFGWRFAEGDMSQVPAALDVVYGDVLDVAFDDASWSKVDLPHDWDIFHAPYIDAPTGNDGGYYPGGIGWYRKTFDGRKINVQPGHTLVLHFEGVYQRCKVYVNGELAGSHAYGYTPFRVDITKLFRPETSNVVAVRVDNSAQPNCRWYSGSGIYRHVWLESYSPEVADDPLKLSVTTEQIFGMSADGTHADSAAVLIQYEGLPAERQLFKDVKLWSPETPVLYDIHYGKLTVRHGFRTIEYDAENGFRLNGQQVKINGACLHHDNGVIGAMAFDAAEIRKVRLMKEAGFNLLRTSHNLQSRAFMDACDSIGMMVIDEIFDGWYTKKTAHDHHEEIDATYCDDIDAMVLRDRNHPCVVCWSIGNEVIERKDIKVIQTASKFKARILANDSTRPVTEALCTWDSEWEIFDPHAAVLDIVGYNYLIDKVPADHERCPERVIWQTESYPRNAFANWDKVNRCSYIIGDIVWTGLDYLGESGIGQFYYDGEPAGEHYRGRHFPFHGAYCGDVDITGWRKPVSHYRDMLWNTCEDSSDKQDSGEDSKNCGKEFEKSGSELIYMAVKEPEGYNGSKISETQWSVWPTWESWNWKGWEGKDIEVEIYTKAPEVKLYLNDRLVATREVNRETAYKAVITLPYEQGTLRAVALDASGKGYVVTSGPQGRSFAEATLQTAGAPSSIRLTADKSKLKADGQDLVYITAEIIDEDGNVVPDDDRRISVSVKGSATFLSAASADLKDLEPMTTPVVTTYKGRAVIVLRSSQKSGKINVSAVSPGLSAASLHLRSDK